MKPPARPSWSGRPAPILLIYGNDDNNGNHGKDGNHGNHHLPGEEWLPWLPCLPSFLPGQNTHQRRLALAQPEVRTHGPDHLPQVRQRVHQAHQLWQERQDAAVLLDCGLQGLPSHVPVEPERKVNDAHS